VWLSLASRKKTTNISALFCLTRWKIIREGEIEKLQLIGFCCLARPAASCAAPMHIWQDRAEVDAHICITRTPDTEVNSSKP
jgi:hypothetical protein